VGALTDVHIFAFQRSLTEVEFSNGMSPIYAVYLHAVGERGRGLAQPGHTSHMGVAGRYGSFRVNLNISSL
jgi:hypothetical protein